MLEGFQNGLLGDFVKDHPAHLFFGNVQHLPEMPGNGLPFPVKIGCEIYKISPGGGFSQIVYHVLLVRENFIAGCPAMLGIDAHSLKELLILAETGGTPAAGSGSGSGKIPHVSDTGLYNILGAQNGINGMNLSRRLHNN